MFKHRLKKRVFDKNQKCYRDIIVHTNARFGSNVFDCHLQQIFENDLVKFDEGKPPARVIFRDAAFWLADTLLSLFDRKELKIIREASNEQA